jgi:hypothetical protein
MLKYGRGGKMPIIDFIETFLDPLLTDFGQMFLSLLFTTAAVVMLTIVNMPKVVLITAALVMMLLFVSFGWLPVWIVVLLMIYFFVNTILNMRQGRDVND